MVAVRTPPLQRLKPNFAGTISGPGEPGSSYIGIEFGGGAGGEVCGKMRG